MYDPLVGNWEMAVKDVVIPPELLGDIVPDYQEGEISVETQGGNTTAPNGKADTSQLTFTLFLPAKNAVKYLAVIFPEAYNAPTSDKQESGNITIGTKACQTRTPVPINIHNVCATTDDTDIFIPAALAKIVFNPTLSTSEAAQIEVTLYMQPDENGTRIRFGTGDLSQPSIYDPTTQKTIPATV